MKLKIGTRKSPLAMWQAHYVADLLEKSGIETEFVTMDSIGDIKLQSSIAEIGAKGAFTGELEDLLKSGGVHLAVHSAKDLPSTLPEGFELIAASKREASHDVLISTHRKGFEELNVIGTASVRRTAILKSVMPHIRTVVVRGNLQTRIRKMDEGHCDALMLAYAGVKRMNLEEKIIHHFSIEVMPPVAGQGIVGIEVHKSLDSEMKQAIFQAVNDEEAMACLELERAFFARLEGGCGLPAFIHVQRNGQFKAIGGVVDPDSGWLLKDQVMVSDKQGIITFADEILTKGGKEILDKIKK